MRDFYTDQRLAVMKQNLAQHEWAQQERDRILKEADRWAAYEDDRLRELVPPPTVPRSSRVSINECPVHGQEVLKVASMYGWKMDFDHPYKVICPVGGENYPSNDFYAYLKTGMQDKSLLTGDYVDDGWGYRKNPDDKYKHWFVGYYAHWMVRNYLHPALRNLSQAYLITGDAKYAHKAGLLLWQLAQYYPDYNYETQSSYGTENDPGYKGRLLYHTWETWTVEEVAQCYDAIFPALAQDAALQKQAGVDAAGVQKQLEDRMLRVMADDIISGSHRIAGNYGMHQKAVLLLALALNGDTGPGNSKQMVDWVLKNPAPASLYTDAAFEDMLTNLIHRDGIPFESPSYNCGWMVNLAEMADLLQENGVDYWANARFRSIFTAPMDALVLGKFTTPLGDSNNMFSGPIGTSAPYVYRPYAQFKKYDPPQAARLARAMGQSPEGFPKDLFQPYLGAEITAEAEKQKPVGAESSLLAGLGNLTLQTGKEGSQTGLSLFYGQYIGHIHFDLLNVDFYAQGQPLTPDLGYPETADSYDPRRFGFLGHTVVHNTCLVNARRQEFSRGQLAAFHPGSFAQMAEVTGNAAYPGLVKDYRRTVMLVDVSPEQAYYVDIFRVEGGHQHDWLVHGTEAEFSSNLPLTEPRKEGTLAGPDVPYGNFYDDEKLKESKYGLYYYSYMGSAFQWLYNVQEARQQQNEAAAPWVQWKMNRDPALFPKEYPRGATLRSHLVPQDETVFACDGTPQRRPQFPEKLKWVVRRRATEGEDLQSAFVTLQEGFLGQEAVKSVRRLPAQPADAVAVEVDLGDRKHVVFSTRNLKQEYVIAGKLRVKGRAAVLEFDAQGQVTNARLFDGESLTCGNLKLTGPGLRTARVKAVDLAKGLVTFDAPCLSNADEGRWLPVTSPTHEAALRADRVVSATELECRQDLVTAAGTVLGIEGSTVQTNLPVYFAERGMTIINERGETVARVASQTGLTLQADRGLKLEAFPDADGDGRARFRVVAIGAGDEVAVGCATSK